MLNKDGQRELCYVVKVGVVEPIEGYDRVEKAHVGGWTILVKKDQFKEGDLGIYFEIDSKVPETEPFEFLASKHFKVKTQKFCKGTVISQGLLMAFEDLPEYFNLNIDGWLYKKENPTKGTDVIDYLVQEGDCLTELLGVKYSIAEDNKRKSNTSKYTAMVQRHQKLFRKNPIVKWLYKRDWGKKLLFLFLGKKKDNQYAFPSHFEYIHRTDEERVENLVPGILQDKEPWIVTEKLDGTSTTFILEKKRKAFGKVEYEFYVSSRNVRQLRPDQANYHSDDSNVYWDMALKYNVEDALKDLLDKNPDWDYVGLQGETFGYGLQGNPNKLKDVRFFGFNLIDSVQGRWNSVDSKETMAVYGIEWVPIIDTNYVLPDTIEELKAQADGDTVVEGGTGLREGFVYRALDGKNSFKNVSNKFLLAKGE